MITVSHLAFEYEQQRVFEPVSFQLRPGTLLHIQGRNGAGKTTLIKILAGILNPSQGEIFHNESPINENLAEYVQKIVYVGHQAGISPLLTIQENYRFELKRYQSPSDLSFNEVVKKLSLSGYEALRCGLLSAGLYRRVALMRLLVSTAPLWLLDEPLTALDKNGIQILKELFIKHLGQGGMILMASHQPLLEDFSGYQELMLF